MEIREKTIEGLKTGDSFTVTRRSTEDDVKNFANISLDYNPVHFDSRFSIAKGFSGRICHGLLVGSMITEIGGQIGWLATEMAFKFKKPIYFGDTITCTFTLNRIDEKGYAEANPYFDISGLDSSHKLSILARLIFNKNISWKDIYTEGIEKVEKIDIEFAKELGYKLKLLGIAKKENNFCELRVHPALLPENHPLCSVEDVYNAIYLEGDLIGKSLLYGKGAGGNPAASAVISDIVDIGMKIKMGNYKNIKFEEDSGLKLLPFDEIKTKYYFRFTCLDKPGVLAKIAKVLGENDISIASVIQKKESPKKAIPVVMLTHLSKEKNVSKALKLIDRLDVIKKPTVRIRVEENGSI